MAFHRSFDFKWTEEVFSIHSVLNTQPVTYKIQDLAGELIQGNAYHSELQKIKRPVLFQIEKKIKYRIKDKKKQVFVKWLSYPEKFNSWINIADIEREKQ